MTRESVNSIKNLPPLKRKEKGYRVFVWRRGLSLSDCELLWRDREEGPKEKEKEKGVN